MLLLCNVLFSFLSAVKSHNAHLARKTPLKTTNKQTGELKNNNRSQKQNKINLEQTTAMSLCLVGQYIHVALASCCLCLAQCPVSKECDSFLLPGQDKDEYSTTWTSVIPTFPQLQLWITRAIWTKRHDNF